MKTYYTIFLAACLALASCEKDFLQRTPQTSIVVDNFFKTTSDLQTYTNGFYDQLGYVYDDLGSDNISAYIAGGEVTNLLSGNLSPANVGGWDDWGNLRTLNYMLDNYGTVVGDTAEINHYIGIARFFRARFYMAKIKRYSDVPWNNHALSNSDSSLYKESDPRALIADSVLNDLQFAADHIKTISGDGTRISKEAALALMSRFCLYEGTYRKYHPEIGLQSDYQRFLEKAVWASEALMATGKFSISGTGAEGYSALFSSPSLSGNKEIILWRASNKELGIANNSHTVFNYQWGLSRSLEESYLMKDGSRYTDEPGYAAKTFTQVFDNRDPRLAETISYPGFSSLNDPSKPDIPLPTLGGYIQLKFYPRDPALRGGWVLDYTALPLFRYAEVLLNGAEAKAELGTITQSDIDNTVNLIRARVNMPPLEIITANSNADPILANYYPNVSGSNKGLILEIRRERRIELACEGFRFDDLQRWYAGVRINDAQQGMYVPALGAMDVTGDGKEDIAILPSPTDTSSIANLPADVRSRLTRFYLNNADGTPGNIYLTNTTSGFIAFTADKSRTGFVEPKYYYRPIPLQQTVLNPDLKQPYGW